MGLMQRTKEKFNKIDLEKVFSESSAIVLLFLLAVGVVMLGIVSIPIFLVLLLIELYSD
jgi:uncharacterized membrane protein YiaA